MLNLKRMVCMLLTAGMFTTALPVQALAESDYQYIPPEMRNRVYCMHFGGDFMSQIKEAGFQVVTSV